ncbi:MAG: TonB family protein [Bacteroidetes bacterium]|nr:MAG: TonB family protein [Bacteroidota bacterium]
MKSIFASVFLLMFTLSAWSQTPSPEPGVHDFIFVQQEPRPLNFEDVKRKIGYPVKAMKSGIEGKVFCRVLVDEQGHYLRHYITRAADPLLTEAVEAGVSQLMFTPALRDERPVKFWVNVPFSFNLKMDRSLARKSLRDASESPGWSFRSGRKARAELAAGLEWMKLQEYTHAIQQFSACIRRAPLKYSKKEAYAAGLSAFYHRAEAYSCQGKWRNALSSYSEVIGRIRTLPVQDEALRNLSLQAHAQRALVFVQMDEPLRAIDDCNWVLSSNCAVELQQKALNHRGLAYLRLGRHEEALGDILEALYLDPEMPLSYFCKALVLQSLGAGEAACESLQETLRRNPEGPLLSDAQSLMAQICQQLAER